MGEKTIFVASLIAFIHVASGGLAPFINKCEAADSKCLKKSTEIAIPIIAAGIPELGIEPLDPMHFKKLDASTNDLKLVLTDVTVVGLKNCETKKIQRDKVNSKIILKFLCSVALEGQYEISGSLLVLPIEGKGKLHAKLNSIVMSFDANMGTIVKDGKEFWVIKSWSHTYKLKEKAELDLENLFQGNEVLGQAARSLLKSSGNDVIREVNPPITQAIIARAVKAIKRFLDKVPLEELALD